MGAAGSITGPPIAELSKEQIAELVVSCGKPYEKYKAMFLKKGIDGARLANANKAQMTSLFKDIGITDEAHKKLLLSKFETLKKSEIKEENSTADDFELRGVTIALFRAVRDQALILNPDPNHWDMGRVSALVVGNHEILSTNNRFGAGEQEQHATLTFGNKSSLIDLLKRNHQKDPHPKFKLIYSQAVGKKANIFVSFAYKDNFCELVEALETNLEDRGADPMTTYFWFDMFVNNQWVALEHDFNWWASTFRTAVQSIGETVIFLSPWSTPSMLLRAWCLYEISCSTKLSVAISKTQRNSFYETLRSNQEDIMTALCNINLENATAWMKEDQERIFEVVRSMDGGFHGFNVIVVGKIREWIGNSARTLIGTHSLREGGEDGIMTEIQLKDKAQFGILLAQQGKFVEARDILTTTANGFEKLLGPDHESTLAVLSNLANLLSELNELEEAQRIYERCLARHEKVLGLEHATTLAAIDSLANVLSDRGMKQEAEVYYDKSMKGLEKLLGFEHATTLKTGNNLACLFCEMGRLEDAKTLHQRVLTGKEIVFGVDHVATLSTVANLADVLRDQGQFDEALVMYKRAHQGYERVLGSDHADTLKITGSLAICYYNQGKVDEAIETFKATLTGYLGTVGDAHPLTIHTISNLGMLLGTAGKTEELNALKIQYPRASI